MSFPRLAFVLILCFDGSRRTADGLHDRIPIAAIFSPGSEESESAFNHAIHTFNSNETHGKRFRVELITRRLDLNEPYQFTQTLCKQMEQGIFALFTNVEDPVFDSLISYSNSFQIPFIHTGFSQKNYFRSISFGLAIKPRYLPAIIDVMKFYAWDKVIYLYDSDYGLVKLQHLFSLGYTDDKYSFGLRAIKRVSNGDEGFEFLRQIEIEDRDSDKLILIDCSSETSKSVINRVVKDIYTNKKSYHFILCSLLLDDYTDRNFIEYGAVNITGFRLVKTSGVSFRRTLKALKTSDANHWNGSGRTMISGNAALTYDAMLVMLDAFKSLLQEKPKLFRNNFRRGQVYNNGTRGIDCLKQSPVQPWEHGATIMRYLKKTHRKGLTGTIMFGPTGHRENFSIDILRMTVNSQMSKIAEWTEQTRLKTIPAKYHRVRHESSQSENKTFVVTSILEEPYLMIKANESGVRFEGNQRFEGYCKDLADLIANYLNFKYEMKLVNDSRYGGFDASIKGGWNGMVGELIRQEADMAIAPLTITSAREKVIDFTKPFMSLGISIMIKKPKKKIPGIFSFMTPLSREIWMCIVLAYIGVSVVLFLVSRFSPYEWKIDCSVKDKSSVGNDFSLANSCWFALGAIMQQGGDICPRSFAGRIVGSLWWFFTLIIVSSYTANLAAFLTVERMVTPINSADDLAKQTEVEYGVLQHSSTMEFFKKSKITVYLRMWEFMNSRPHVFVESYKEAIRRVRESNGKYAFLMESTQNDYINEREPCDTMKVGRNLDAKGFGVASPRGSPMRVGLNLAVLYLLENGDLQKLENKWWYDRSECKQKEGKQSSHSSLALRNVAGCFYILIFGLVLGVVVAIVEFTLKVWSVSKRNKVSFGEALHASFFSSVLGVTSGALLSPQ